MDNFKENTNSELLTQLLDGELSSAHEESLYATLSKSKELQEELRQQLLIRESIRKDTEAYNPPSAAVIGLFNKLAYAPPYAIMTGGSLLKATFWNTMFKRASVSLALLALLTFSSYHLIGLLNDDETPSTVQTQVNTITSVEEAENIITSFSENLEATKGASVAMQKPIPIMTSNSVQSTPQIEPKVSSVIDENASESQSIAVHDNSYRSINVIESSSFIINAEEITFTRNSDFGFINYQAPRITGSSNINVYLKVNAPTRNIASLGFDGSLLNNKSFGINFLKRGSFSGGFEIGQNTYRAKVTSDEDENTLIDKDMNVFWYTLNGRYDVNDLEMFNVHPFLQLAAGSGNFGKYMVRYNAGLEYNFQNSEFSLMVGWEGSNLWYSTQNKSFNTNTGGLIFGMSYKF